MLINSLDEFVKCIPTATGTEWDVLLPYVETAQMDLTINLLGTDLNAALTALQATDGTRLIANKLLAISAYHAAIPFVDLQQTPNGFAVVSNNNLAPASKERVERLITWCEMQIDGLIDLLIKSVLGSSTLLQAWTLFPQFTDIVNCLFITGQDFAGFINSKEKLRRAELLRNKAQLLIWQENILAPVISKSYLTQLISELRTQTITPGSANIIHYCKMVLAALMLGSNTQADSLLSKISNLLDANLATYSTYAASDEYTLKNSPRDMNKADHPTYFMGI